MARTTYYYLSDSSETIEHQEISRVTSTTVGKLQCRFINDSVIYGSVVVCLYSSYIFKKVEFGCDARCYRYCKNNYPKSSTGPKNLYFWSKQEYFPLHVHLVSDQYEKLMKLHNKFTYIVFDLHTCLWKNPILSRLPESGTKKYTYGTL